jgi:hypothetical protein
MVGKAFLAGASDANLSLISIRDPLRSRIIGLKALHIQYPLG